MFAFYFGVSLERIELFCNFVEIKTTDMEDQFHSTVTISLEEYEVLKKENETLKAGKKLLIINLFGIHRFYGDDSDLAITELLKVAENSLSACKSEIIKLESEKAKLETELANVKNSKRVRDYFNL